MTPSDRESSEALSLPSRRFRRISVGAFLGMLVLFVVAMPFLQGLSFGDLVVSGLLTLIMASGVIMVGANRVTLVSAAVLAVPTVAAKWINHYRPDLLPASLYLLGGVLFLGFVMGHLLRFTLRAKRVSTDVLWAGIATYLVLGLLWTLAYLLAAQLVPDAFNLPGKAAPGQGINSFEALYFSFVTLSTMGYGDILPTASVTRMMAIVEAMTGVFFVSVLIARLVALYTTEAALDGMSDDHGSPD